MDNSYPNIAPESNTPIEDITISYHPKPQEYDMYEWVELCKAYHFVRGRDIITTECVVKYVETTEPYPDDRQVESHGIDVHWR